MHNYDLSIVIPMYNSDQTIQRCLQSVKYHSNRVEIIVVDDGSEDSSVDTAKQIMGPDLDFRIYRQPNQGVSAARNLGINKSSGRWLIFLDSDDVMQNNWENSCFRAIDSNLKADVFIFDEDANGRVPSFRDALDLTLGIPTGEEYGLNMMAYVSSKIFNTSFIEANGIRFKSGVLNGEDMLFNCAVIAAKPRIRISASQLYVYVKNMNSSSNSFNEALFQNELLFLKELVAILNDVISPEEMIKIRNFVQMNGSYILLYRIATARNKAYLRNLYFFLHTSSYMEALSDKLLMRQLEIKRSLIVKLLRTSHYNLAYHIMRAIIVIKKYKFRIEENL